jgi:hypothetical protein
MSLGGFATVLDAGSMTLWSRSGRRRALRERFVRSGRAFSSPLIVGGCPHGGRMPWRPICRVSAGERYGRAYGDECASCQQADGHWHSAFGALAPLRGDDPRLVLGRTGVRRIFFLIHHA